MYKYERNRFSIDTTNIKPSHLNILAENKSFYDKTNQLNNNLTNRIPTKSPIKKDNFPNTLSRFFQSENEKIQSTSPIKRVLNKISENVNINKFGTKLIEKNKNLPNINMNR
jgi:hypothetical protein